MLDQELGDELALVLADRSANSREALRPSCSLTARPRASSVRSTLEPLLAALERQHEEQRGVAERASFSLHLLGHEALALVAAAAGGRGARAGCAAQRVARARRSPRARAPTPRRQEEAPSAPCAATARAARSGGRRARGSRSSASPSSSGMRPSGPKSSREPLRLARHAAVEHAVPWISREQPHEVARRGRVRRGDQQLRLERLAPRGRRPAATRAAAGSARARRSRGRRLGAPLRRVRCGSARPDAALDQRLERAQHLVVREGAVVDDSPTRV